MSTLQEDIVVFQKSIKFLKALFKLETTMQNIVNLETTESEIKGRISELKQKEFHAIGQIKISNEKFVKSKENIEIETAKFMSEIEKEKSKATSEYDSVISEKKAQLESTKLSIQKVNSDLDKKQKERIVLDAKMEGLKNFFGKTETGINEVGI